jgi:two-component sensor histidine kinase
MGQSPGYSESVPGAADEIAVLRHELANVLNGLAGMTKLLKSSALGPEQTGWLDAIEGSADQMRYLLRHSGAGSGLTAPGNVSRMNGQRVLEQALTAHAPSAAAKGLRLMLTVAADLPVYWHSDKQLLRQLLDNLLANAVKFTDSGDVAVTARAGDGRCLDLAVRDTGPGVPASDRARIFRVRERGVSAQERPGAGLGLSICSRITAELGGVIECRPGQGGGTEFTVSLPRALGRCGEFARDLSAFRDIRCVLDLEGPLGRSLAGFLDRLGICHCSRAGAGELTGGDGLDVTVTEAPRKPGEPWPGVWLNPSGSPERVQPALLRPPVLESALERAFLELALCWRWQRLSPGGTRD